MPGYTFLLTISGLCLSQVLAKASTNSAISSGDVSHNATFRYFTPSLLNALPDKGEEKCPPCFNCLLPVFSCGQYGECNPYDGQCKCPPGFGGVDCLTPLCGALADGDHRYPRPDDRACDCKEGWGGINCNVCQNDNACREFPLPGDLAQLGEEPLNMTCYKGGETVYSNHQMCDVTNRKILDMLPDRPPQVTFSCDKASSTCAFQFWIGQKESFYCALDTCSTHVEAGYDFNATVYGCEHVKCSCIPGRMLCGEAGSVDIGDFLDESIKGPASFTCKTGKGCQFEEPAMNELINDIFGDQFITLKCDGGECLHFTQVPGYVRPVRPDNRQMVAFSAAVAGLIFVMSCGALWYLGRTSKHPEGFGQIKLPADEAAKLMTDHIPASLHFSNISYTLPGTSPILDSISGSVKSGQILAIMGASGAGKSTCLDILARRSKRGTVGGEIRVNGRLVKDSEYKKVVGFVDQEDTLMSTLTVYETVLYSALLRLPREMSIEAKKFRTLETMQELGILGIKDSRIGDAGHRSISGGEKRRVSIACELVTSPSILFLDEPTSGLDAFNAFNVVESLASLARNYNRTVVFTIHQPRSNIVTMFDQLLVLAGGKTVYSGQYAKVQEYFQSIGFPCPTGFNIADYFIDITMNKGEENTSDLAPVLSEADMSDESSRLQDEERGLGGSRHDSSLSLQGRTPVSGQSVSDEGGLDARPAPGSVTTVNSLLSPQKSSVAMRILKQRSQGGVSQMTPRLASLVSAYARSSIAAEVQAEWDNVMANADPDNQPTAQRSLDVAMEANALRSHKRASWLMQFRILSGRAFKNLYRDPSLLTAHYTASVVIALLCGALFRNVTNDISGFQNRLGLFFFTLAMFGFACLSSLNLFANERILFMRERANGYYSSFTYFASKVLFDIVPLRVVPPLVFGSIAYSAVGLVPTVAAFWKFQLTLVLFNLTTASSILLISVAIANTGVATLVGTLVMLYNLLFAGLLINRDSTGYSVKWLHNLSFFHAAYEALAVNELRYLQLKEIKYGVELDVPAATILSIFGFRAQAFWWPDIATLAIMLLIFITSSFAVLHYFVKEKR
ncbi:hypothetical protein FRC03_008981 [Tulasnella sp. 419]|nr:hypothetical protein FRC02_005690 [Tulasnella sp. 418]KAG8967960.1 hypothetical protein FRC03_008981 [Tulasnella sp. 419]